MAKKTMEDIVAQIESDIQMTVKRRAYALIQVSMRI